MCAPRVAVTRSIALKLLWCLSYGVSSLFLFLAHRNASEPYTINPLYIFINPNFFRSFTHPNGGALHTQKRYASHLLHHQRHSNRRHSPARRQRGRHQPVLQPRDRHQESRGYCQSTSRLSPRERVKTLNKPLKKVTVSSGLVVAISRPSHSTNTCVLCLYSSYLPDTIEGFATRVRVRTTTPHNLTPPCSDGGASCLQDIRP